MVYIPVTCKECECEWPCCQSADCVEHVKLLRTHVSNNAAGKMEAVLEGVGFKADAIAVCSTAHPQDDVKAVQKGLKMWVDGKGTQPPTWELLIEAMVYAEIAQQHVEALKKDLGH